MSDIDVNNATREALIEYARSELGLKVNANINKPELQQLIAKQTGQRVDSAQIPDDSPAMIAQNLREMRKFPKVKIRIAEDKTYPKRIFISCNGVDYTIKPGAIVEVPSPVVEVLRNARQHTIEQVEENGRLRNITQESLQYNFEVLS